MPQQGARSDSIMSKGKTEEISLFINLTLDFPSCEFKFLGGRRRGT